MSWLGPNFVGQLMMWGGSIRENEFLIFWLVGLEVAIYLRVMRPQILMQNTWRMGGCHVSRCILSFHKPFEECWDTLRGEHDFAISVYVVDASHCGSVHFLEYRVAWGRFGIVSLVLHEISVSDPVLCSAQGLQCLLEGWWARCQNWLCSEVWCHKASRVSFLVGW